MARRYFPAVLAAGCAMTASAAWAAPAICEGEREILASPAGEAPAECLRLKAFVPEQLRDSADTLLVWLHGDLSSSGTAETSSPQAIYHNEMAERAVQDHPGKVLASVALVRPGYKDEQGVESNGDWNGGANHYTDANMHRVGRAVANLKARYGAANVVLVGHSGGAATAANVLGMYPSVVNDAILASCPCDVPTWRSDRGRNPWPDSLNPLDQANGVDTSSKVLALTAQGDDNTLPKYAQDYVQALQGRGVSGAEFQLVTDQAFNSHNGVLRSDDLRAALSRLLDGTLTIQSFTINGSTAPAPIQAGEKAALAWQAPGTTVCHLNSDKGGLKDAAQSAPQGSYESQALAAGVYDYTLTCRNDASQSTAPVTRSLTVQGGSDAGGGGGSSGGDGSAGDTGGSGGGGGAPAVVLLMLLAGWAARHRAVARQDG